MALGQTQYGYNNKKMLPVAAASERRRLITALHAHCALKLSTFAAIAACAKRVSPPAAPRPRAFFLLFPLRLTRVNNREKGQNAEVKKTIDKAPIMPYTLDK